MFYIFLENNYFELFQYQQFYARAQCTLILSRLCFALPCALSNTFPFLPSSFLSFLLKKKEYNKTTKSNWHVMLGCWLIWVACSCAGSRNCSEFLSATSFLSRRQHSILQDPILWLLHSSPPSSVFLKSWDGCNSINLYFKISLYKHMLSVANMSVSNGDAGIYHIGN